jgi:polysaccharide biosynthesis/export protein
MTHDRLPERFAGVPRRIVGLALALAFSGSALAAQPSSAPASAGAPVFRVGDAVRITVWRSPELSGQFEIAEDGTVIHPLYRAIRIAGSSVAQAEDAVRALLERFEARPEFVVEPLFRIAIGGEVRSPNIYTLSPQTTVAQAVTEAGGPTARAQMRRVRLLRDGQLIAVDLTRPHDELAHLRVRSGDQIVVDTRANLWRDYVSPTITAVGSLASIAYLFLRLGSTR